MQIVCHNCKEKGRFYGDCPHPKKKCSECQRMGHLGEFCRKSVRDRRTGEQQIVMRTTRSGTIIEMKDQPSSESYCRSFGMQFNKEADRIKHLNQQAALRRSRKVSFVEEEDGEIPSREDPGPTTTDTIMTGNENTATGKAKGPLFFAPDRSWRQY